MLEFKKLAHRPWKSSLLEKTVYERKIADLEAKILELTALNTNLQQQLLAKPRIKIKDNIILSITEN